MTGYPYRTQWAWFATLALTWLVLWSPWPTGWNILIAVLVCGATLTGFTIASQRIQARLKVTRHVLDAVDAALTALPADIKRNTPLILAVGDAIGPLDVAFATQLVHVTSVAIWIRCDEPTRLAHMAHALKHWRAGQGPDGVAYLLGAGWIDSEAMLAASLKRWRTAIDEASRAVGSHLPVCVALYAEETHDAVDDCPWFGVSSGTPLSIETVPTLIVSQVAQYTNMAPPMLREPRAYRAALLDALTRWARQSVLPALIDTQHGNRPLRITGFGVTTVTGWSVPTSLYSQFIAQVTGLTLTAMADTRLVYPLPEPLIRGLPLQPAQRFVPRAIAHAFGLLAVAFCAAAAASCWQNRALFGRVANDISRYQALAPSQDAERVDALTALKRDRNELTRYTQFGVPPRLGLGFYRSAALLPLTRALISGYQSPSAPATPSTVIELDSLPLFESGSATLNPGSNRLLVGALEMIKAHPNQRVLIAGHTDAVGNPQHNLELSEARAATVRNWLADAAGIPTSHFAIQGYGDTRPKDSNDTVAGRAANRRVEITLIPDCRNNSAGHFSSTGHPACIFD